MRGSWNCQVEWLSLNVQLGLRVKKSGPLETGS